MNEIPLAKTDLTVLVDKEHFAFLSQYRWFKQEAFGLTYAATYIDGKPVRMHRLIKNAPKHLFVDHINGNGLDNRSSNLRLCTSSQNLRNQKVNPNKGTSKYKGVYWSKSRCRWFASIRLNAKKVVRKVFHDEKEAAKYYDHLAVIYFGEFARLNFPN